MAKADVVLNCRLRVELDEADEYDLDNKLDEIMRKIEDAVPGIYVSVDYVE